MPRKERGGSSEPHRWAEKAYYKWLVMGTTVMALLIILLDVTVVNVATPHIIRDFNASISDIQWAFNSYTIAFAALLIIFGRLGDMFGHKTIFLVGLVFFGVSSALSGASPSIDYLIFFRMLQGIGGAMMMPATLALTLSAFPPHQRGMALGFWGAMAGLALAIGPVLGGFIVDNYSWRWIFYINIPVGAIAFLASYFLLDDPEYLQQERAELKRRPFQFDAIGISLLAIVLACWEIVLSKGQQWDWFGDPTYRVHLLAGLFTFGLVAFVFRELMAKAPVVSLAPFRERNFTVGCIIAFGAYAVLYGTSTSLPGLLQSLFAYDATASGLVLSPSGIFSLMCLPIIGIAIGRGADARWLVLAGLLVMGGGCFWMAQYNLSVSPAQIVWPRVLTSVGLSILFAPLSVAAYMYTPQSLRGAAVGIFSLLRNEGGSVGTSLAQTFHERRDQFHALRLGEFIDRFNPIVESYLAQTQAAFLSETGDPVAAEEMAIETLGALREQQSSSLAFFDVFWAFAVLSLVMAGMTLLMKRSVAEKGAHVAMD
jgi:DHA2 family multidrug resistance protein